MSRILLALGGNALGDNYIDQQIKIKETMQKIIPLIKEGHELIITHGNGPQVGFINDAFEANEEEIMPMDACTAMSQGYIGFHIQKELKEVLIENQITKDVATIITQVLVNKNDPAFENPTKPIGKFYSQETADKIMQQTKATFIEDAGRGYRKVVASPIPIDIKEIKTIKDLINNNHIVITCGGGGIPVINDFESTAVNAVIDKDLASSKLAIMLNCDYLIILTTVSNAYLNYGQPNAIKLEKISFKEAEQYLNEFHFLKGSMYPKIEAAIEFVKATNNKTIITNIENINNALNETNCTVIY